jgi:hypothetical protein
MTASLPQFAIVLALALGGCSSRPDFDGLYTVDSYSLNEVSCSEAGAAIEPEFTRFEVRSRDWFGVTIYPVYPCDDSGSCAEDNDARWSLVTLEEDLDQVSMTSAASAGNTCLLSAVDLVIDGVEGNLVLEERTFQAVLEPYDASTCTPGRAEAMQDEMACAQLRQLVGTPERASGGGA